MTTFNTTVLPCSVIDLEAQTKNKNKRKKGEGNFEDSSRKVMSHHPKETCLIVYELFLRNARSIFDPFAGFGQRHFYAKQFGKFYTGYDCSQPNIAEAKKEFGVVNVLKDSAQDELPEYFDAVYTCPPYWNLEKYEGGAEGGDKLKTWEEFCDWYEDLWTRIIQEAPEGTTFCIQVGNWRAKGIFYDLEYLTQKVFDLNDCPVIDKVILSRKKVSKIKVMAPQAKSKGYTVKVHETLLVFKK
jgi:hypothetical protein